MKRSADLTEPAGGSRAKDQADINVSPETTERNPTETDVDLVDTEQSSDPDLNCFKTESQAKTELSMLQMYIRKSVIRLLDRLDECFLHWTPVSEVWPSAFIGNQQTAMDRVKLEKMGVTHILNAAYFFSAAEFIHKALSKPENKVLVHCLQGVSRSSTLFLAYLMIHHDMRLEDAIDHVTCKRRIQPNIGFLNQLTLLNLNLVRQRELQLRKQLNIENIVMLVPVSESQVKLRKHMRHIMIHLKQLLQKCTLDWTPVTEVWPNVFIGNEETAMDRVRLKEMGVTHILNAAAVKKSLKVLLGMSSKEDLLEKVNTGAKYYKGMNIT
ncbi:hypothetical protein G5714_004572 [Onychostoma macrolepis]|uniref:Protein-serine/threonine phosphatase n=1 Tax=Onychostoma macrolepis TaxID=369639 RepID=A0A7J6D513_9TELE|nr:hypothetical protein G5714_004572 [Onychostoma macrolepis]